MDWFGDRREAAVKAPHAEKRTLNPFELKLAAALRSRCPIDVVTCGDPRDHERGYTHFARG